MKEIKETEEVIVLLNERTAEIINSMKITYSSAGWKVLLLSSIKKGIEEVSLIEFFIEIDDIKRREKQITDMCTALSLNKIPYFRDIKVRTFRNMDDSEVGLFIPTRRVKLK